ncbi:GH25 family lysozyme, partial [Arthrobacter livingstonensis]
MFTTRPKLISCPTRLPSLRLTRIAAAGLVAASLALSMGTVPAKAAPGESTATSTEVSVPSTSVPIAEPATVPTREPTPAPALDPLPETVQSPSAAATTAPSTPVMTTAPTTIEPSAEAGPSVNPGETLAEQQGALGAAMGQGAKKLAMNVDPQAAIPAKRSMMAAPYAESLSATFRPAGVQGLDVSGWQPNVSWAAQANLGAKFAYIKATEGNNFTSSAFGNQYTGAANAGFIRGAYHFALPGQSSAVAQADFFVNNGGGWSGDGKTLPPLLDIEYNPYSTLGNTCYNFSQSSMVTWIKDFSNRVKARTGRLPMIYTTTDWWSRCTGNSSAFSNQPLHVAAYSTVLGALPNSWSVQSVWQYSSTGPFDGDSNAWNGTLASLKTFATKADAQVPKPPTVPANNPSIPSPADLVAADGSGALWRYPATGSGGFGARKQIGQSWTGMRSITVIDWNSDGVLDLIAQRTNGSLSLYKGLRGGGFSGSQSLAASGWGTSQLTIGYWLNSSKYPQILARAANGDVNLWANPAGSSLGAAQRIAQGWNGINMTMLDFDGDGRQDILAQYPDGTLRLARSNGAGAFINEPRKTIGSGWNAFTSITVYSDFAFSGSNGLIWRTAAGAISYVPVPSNSKFGSVSAIGSGWGSFLIAGGENINPPQKPQAPPTPKAVAGNGRASITVAKNASSAASTSILVTASPGGSNCTIAAASGTCTVAGLANGKSYTFKAAASNAGGFSPSSSASSPVVPYNPVSRVAGADRYAVSAAVSKATFAPGVSVAYIASGAVFPDALS